MGEVDETNPATLAVSGEKTFEELLGLEPSAFGGVKIDPALLEQMLADEIVIVKGTRLDGSPNYVVTEHGVKRVEEAAKYNRSLVFIQESQHRNHAWVKK